MNGLEPLGGADGARARPRAMVIEDSCVIALDLEGLLAHDLGCDVRICSTDARTALAEIDTFRPDLVVSDLSVLLRYEVTPADLEAPGRGLVVVTGDTQAAACYAAEGREILIKPYCLPELARKFREILGVSALPDRAGDSAGHRAGHGGTP